VWFKLLIHVIQEDKQLSRLLPEAQSTNLVGSGILKTGHGPNDSILPPTSKSAPHIVRAAKILPARWKRKKKVEPRPHAKSGLPPFNMSEKHFYFVPVIPKTLNPIVLKLFHDVPHAAHMGMNKTLEKIRQRCYWSGKNKDICEYVHSCDICQKVNSLNHLPCGLLHSVPPPT